MDCATLGSSWDFSGIVAQTARVHLPGVVAFMDDQVSSPETVRARRLAASGPASPCRLYEVTVAGAVSPGLLAALEDVEVYPEQLSTVLSGQFRDQAALYRLLSRLRSFALEIVEIRRAVVAPSGQDTERQREG
jgi:hypothetical protein